jgi:hypothetical protein
MPKKITKKFWSKIKMSGLYGCENSWALTVKEINRAHQNIPMIPTPATENLAITMSKSVAFEAQKKLAQFLKDNNLLDHKLKNVLVFKDSLTLECEDDCLSCKILKEFGVKWNATK